MVKYKKATTVNLPLSHVAEKTAVVNHTNMGLICSFVALMLYANTICNNYALDDDMVIKANKITTTGISALPAIFTSVYRAGYTNPKEGLYRPLSVAMFAIEWQLAPGKPWLNHLINVLLYILTAWLLYQLIRSLLIKHHPLIPFFITILFVVLPVHTEVVANIKSRDEILCFLFLVISMQQIINWISNKKSYSLIFSIAAFFFALLSKESAITFVVCIPLLAYFFTPANNKQILIIISSFLLLAVSYLTLRIVILGSLTSSFDIQLDSNSLAGTDDHLTRLATATYIMGKYILLLLFPVTLLWDYSYNTIPLVSPASIKVIVSASVYIVLIWYVIRNYKTRNPIAFGVLFFLITMSIVSNIFFLIESELGERFLYTPSIGFCLAFVLSLTSVFKKQIKRTGTILEQVRSNPAFYVLTFLIIIYSFRTVARNMDWKNNITLVEKDVISSPNSIRIRMMYGLLLYDGALKETDKNRKHDGLVAATKQFEACVAIIDDHPQAWYHLGLAYKELRDTSNLIRAFDKLHTYADINDVVTLNITGMAYTMGKQYDKAIADLKYALAIDSTSIETMNNLGKTYILSHKFEEADELYQKIFRLNPGLKTPYFNLGFMYQQVGETRKAMNYYFKATSLDSLYSDAYMNIANCFASLKMLDSAKYYFEKTLAVDPKNSKATLNMAIVFRMMGDSLNSKIWYKKAWDLNARN